MKIIERIRTVANSVVGMNQRNLELIYPNNHREDYKLADDKYLAKGIMEDNCIACPKTFGTIDQIGRIAEVWEVVKEWNRLVIKPAKGAGGKGILILRKENKQWFKGQTPIDEEQIFAHIANIIFGIYSFGDSDRVLIEEYVQPHHFFTDIYPAGVPDFRIILLKGIPLMAMLRLPTSASDGKANLHQGGLGIGIDIETGMLKEAYDGKQHLKNHPDSGSVITGKRVPFWSRVMELSIETAACFPLDYLGVDLVIDQVKGPMIMEVNVRPGLAIQIANKQGLKEAIVEYAPQFTNLQYAS
ncbi:MAG: sugar-transfer associated ATP-grasp domain-containing protein [Bacteroidota bacterium]